MIVEIMGCWFFFSVVLGTWARREVLRGGVGTRLICPKTTVLWVKGTVLKGSRKNARVPSIGGTAVECSVLKSSGGITRY